jgi:hypothetical protein
MPFPFAAAAQFIPQGVDLLSQLFGGGQGKDMSRGYEDMRRMIEQGMGARRDYTDRANTMLDPWQRTGAGEMRGYNENYKRLMDPNFIKQIQSEWAMSPSAKMQLEKGTGAINNAASASGMLGSTDFGRDQADYARNITSADQQQHLQNRMNAYMGGLGHQGSTVGMGLNAGGQMSNNYMNLGNALAGDYGQMGQAMQGQRYGEGMQRDDMARSIGGMGKSIFDYLGGGGDSANDTPGRARLPTPQFRRYG